MGRHGNGRFLYHTKKSIRPSTVLHFSSQITSFSFLLEYTLCSRFLFLFFLFCLFSFFFFFFFFFFQKIFSLCTTVDPSLLIQETYQTHYVFVEDTHSRTQFPAIDLHKKISQNISEGHHT